MAYLGKPSINRATGTSKDSFNGDGSTTAFTMSRSVLLVTDIEVFVDNVQQEPTVAYSVSSTTLTFTEAPPNGTANVYVIHRSGNNDSMKIQSGITPTFTNVIIANEQIGDLLSKHIMEERAEREELAEKVAFYEKEFNINPLSWGKRKKK